MPITLRSVKGANLTAAEVDANFMLPRSISVNFVFPQVGDYKIVVKAPHGGTLNEITTVAESGTGSLSIKINAAAVTATANAVSATEQSQVPSAANVWVAGDDIVVSFSAVSSLVKASVTLRYTPN